MSVLDALASGLIVSCQAPAGHPLRDPDVIARLALSAEQAGAVGVRVNGVADVAAVRARVSVPIIGLWKQRVGERWLITTAAEHARLLAEAGADVVAVEVSEDSPNALDVVDEVVCSLRLPVMADVGTLEDARRALDHGATVVGTTLSGYLRRQQPHPMTPDLDLVAQCARLGPVLAEGRYARPADVRAAFDAGALAVVVGTAITDPRAIARSFVAVTPAFRSG